MSQRDYYEILEVERTVTTAELKISYRRLAMRYHPDRNTDDQKNAEAKFKEVKEAHDILKDPQKRSTYDQFGHDGLNQQSGFGGGGGFGDAFGDIFGDIFGGGRGQQQNQMFRGADLAYQMQMTLEESAFGIEKEISIPKKIVCDTCDGSGAKPGTAVDSCVQCNGQGQVIMQQGFIQMQQACPVCHGSGKQIKDPCTSCHASGVIEEAKTLSVKIPAGVETGDRIRLRGEGEAGENGGPAGDLFVQVAVKPHDIFERDGQDLHCDVPISFATATLGGSIQVPTLTGDLKLKIPAETQSDKVFKLRDKGVSSARRAGTGDLFCRVMVETPVNLSNKQKELLSAFDKTMDDSREKYSPKDSSWKDKVKSFIDGL